MGIDAREPEISVSARRILAALLISIGLHAALIGWLRFQPITGAALGRAPIQVRLISITRTLPPKAQVPTPTPTPVANPRVAHSAAATEPSATPPDRLAVEVPVQVDDTYYPTRELDVPPQPLIKVNPEYPAQAVGENLQGWVVLKMKIDYLGRVQLIEVQAADPPGVFDQASLDAFRQVKFAPAQKAGHAVNSLIQIKVRFQLK